MESAVIRDYLVVIAGGLIIVTIIVAGILIFLLYRQINSLTKSIKSTARMTQELGVEVKKAVKSSKELIALFNSQRPKSETKIKDKTGAGSAT